MFEVVVHVRWCWRNDSSRVKSWNNQKSNQGLHRKTRLKIKIRIISEGNAIWKNCMQLCGLSSSRFDGLNEICPASAIARIYHFNQLFSKSLAKKESRQELGEANFWKDELEWASWMILRDLKNFHGWTPSNGAMQKTSTDFERFRLRTCNRPLDSL